VTTRAIRWKVFLLQGNCKKGTARGGDPVCCFLVYFPGGGTELQWMVKGEKKNRHKQPRPRLRGRPSPPKVIKWKGKLKGKLVLILGALPRHCRKKKSKAKFNEGIVGVPRYRPAWYALKGKTWGAKERALTIYEALYLISTKNRHERGRGPQRGAGKRLLQLQVKGAKASRENGKSRRTGLFTKPSHAPPVSLPVGLWSRKPSLRLCMTKRNRR